ncbi:MAG: ATP synthase F1 subunit delta [Planctomycetes bacterium]|nr:ATP synthase F1 subunit delta [Planctomycetota bacterium]
MTSADLILRRYATALYELAHEAGVTETVEAELGDLDAVLAENPDLRTELANPRLGRDRKRAILEQVMGPSVSELLSHTVLLLSDKGRAGLLPGFGRVFDEVARAASGREIAKVESAVPLGDDVRARLKTQLARITGKDITLVESVEASLLGGIRVTIGSRMIDGSLKRRLEMLQDSLLTAPLASRS